MMWKTLLPAIVAGTVAAGVPATGVQAAQGYVVKGRVVTAAGKPVRGAKIVLDNNLLYDSNLVLHTNSKGYYYTRLPRKQATWKAYGTLARTFHGQRLEFTLSPNTVKAFRGSKGAVRNFVWKLSGPRKDAPGRFHGGIVQYNLWSDNVPDGGLYQENVRLKLTPVSLRVDGAKGKTISGRTPVWYDPYGWAVADVPVARYRITATYDGVPLQVKLTGSYDFHASVTADFKQDVTTQRIRLEVRYPG